MSEVKWIKICVDIFDDEKILLIENLQKADSILVIWFKLLCLAGKQNNSGVFTIQNGIPYTEEMLATIFRRKQNLVKLALKTFEELGMVEIINNAVTIPNWEKHQKLDGFERAKEQTRKRVAKHREKQKQIAENCNVTSNDISNDNETLCNSNVTLTDKDKEEDKEEDKEKEREKESGSSALQNSKPTRHKYGEYQNVLLSDEELEKLKTEFPEDWQSRIENLSEYIASSGKSYKNHLATIRKWAKFDAEKQNENKRKGKGINNYADTNKPDYSNFAEEILAEMLGEN